MTPPGPVVFDLRLSRGFAGWVSEARCGGVDLPRTEVDLATLELRAKQAQSTPRVSMERREQIELGSSVFKAVFRGSLLRHWDRARGRAWALEVPFLVRVYLPDEETLHHTPWEWLHDGWDFLAKNSCYGALVRCVKTRREPRPWQMEGQIHLLVTRGPGVRGGPEITWGPVWQELVDLERREPEKIKLQLVDQPVSFHELEALFSKPSGPQVWHHIGHGRCLPSSPDVFRLLLASPETEDGVWTRADRVAEITGLCPSLKMVVLGACHSAEFDGLAPELARLDIPYVIGFPWAAGLQMAQRMTVALYTSLLSYPPELALSFARHSISGRGAPSLEWGQAILYARHHTFGTHSQRTAVADRTAATDSSPVQGAGQYNISNIRAGRDARFVGPSSMNVDRVWAGRDVTIRGRSAGRRHFEQLRRTLDRLDRRRP